MPAKRIHIAGSTATAGEAAAQKGCDLLQTVLAEQEAASVVFATGASQFDLLDHLIAAPNIDWHRVRGFHLDEYLGLSISHPASFRKYLWERLISRLPVPMKSFHYLDGEANPAEELARSNHVLHGISIDLAFIGIGENGHIAFNDPPANFETQDPFIVVELDDACRRQQLNEGWFPSFEAVPTHAISMSVNQIMKSDAIICTVPDTRKANAVKAALEGPVSPDVPASILQHHPNCHFFLDKHSAVLLSPQSD